MIKKNYRIRNTIERLYVYSGEGSNLPIYYKYIVFVVYVRSWQLVEGRILAFPLTKLFNLLGRHGQIGVTKIKPLI